MDQCLLALYMSVINSVVVASILFYFLLTFIYRREAVKAFSFAEYRN